MNKHFQTILLLLYTFVLPVDLIETVMALVEVCPESEREVIQASRRLGCGNDRYGNNRYLCLPNKKKTSLVEFCFYGVMGIEERGNCLEFYEGELIRHSCNHFLYGCPETHFYDYEFYKYPACQKISTELQCYVLDRYCTAESNTEEPSSNNNVIYTTIIVGSVFVIIIISIITLCYKRRKTELKKRTDQLLFGQDPKESIEGNGEDDQNGLKISDLQADFKERHSSVRKEGNVEDGKTGLEMSDLQGGNYDDVTNGLKTSAQKEGNVEDGKTELEMSDLQEGNYDNVTNGLKTSPQKEGNVEDGKTGLEMSDLQEGNYDDVTNGLKTSAQKGGNYDHVTNGLKTSAQKEGNVEDGKTGLEMSDLQEGNYDNVTNGLKTSPQIEGNVEDGKTGLEMSDLQENKTDEKTTACLHEVAKQLKVLAGTTVETSVGVKPTHLSIEFDSDNERFYTAPSTQKSSRVPSSRAQW